MSVVKEHPTWVAGAGGGFVDVVGAGGGLNPFIGGARVLQAPAAQIAKEASASPSVDLPFATKSLELKALNETTRTADFVASTGIVDSHGEIVDQNTWRLADYLANPVVLFGHQSRELPIGKTIDVAVRNGRLECRIEFAPAVMNPMAEQCWQMVKSGFLRATSVGFMPMTGRYEMRSGEEVWVWSDCVLKEISVVPVPANPECLAKMKAKILGQQTEQKSPPAPPVAPQQAENGKEEGMDVKELLAKIAALETEQRADKTTFEKALAEMTAKAASETKRADEATAKIATLETEKAAFEAQTKTLAEERDAANKKLAELEAKAIEAEVDALVGKKIKPTEKATFLKLRTTNPDLFGEMVAQRDDMKLLEQIVPAEKTGNSDLEEFTKA